MADITVFTQPGENGVAGGGGDPIELFLEKFGGEVAQAYAENLILAPRARIKTLGGGAKSHTFGATGKLAAIYHLRGADKQDDLDEMEIGERLIHLDRPFSVPTFVDDWEEFANHFDIRGPIAAEMGQAIAESIETNLMRLLVKGATASAGPLADHPGGNVITSVNSGTSGSALVTAIEDMVEFWNTNSVPKAGRFVCVKPAQYRLLAAQSEFHDSTLNNGANGSRKEGEIGRVVGVDVLESNLVPTTNFTTAPAYSTNGMVNDYRGDATNVTALFGTGRSLGMVQTKGLKIAMDKQERYGGTFFYGSRTVGAGLLREVDCGMVQTS